MKKIISEIKNNLVWILPLIFLFGCSNSDRGYLVGVQGREIWQQADPFGMLFIPHGSYNMGQNDQDVPYSHISQTKTVTITAFYMDETEITNNEYRQFVFWVRDSIARKILGDVDETFLISENAYGEFYEPPYINWEKKIRWDGEQEREALVDMYLQEHERFYRK